MKTKIVVVGLGYVGISNAILLSQKNEVIAIDIDEQKVNSINNKISPVQDDYINLYLKEKKLNLEATTEVSACKDAEFIVVCVPTDYDTITGKFDVSKVEEVIETVLIQNKNAVIIIKSTVPIGYCEMAMRKYNTKKILFSPEFLRESRALYDNLYPSRIIVGCLNENKKYASYFALLLQEGAIKRDIKTIVMGLREAESVKLFSNTYLALRISYFNELDTYAEINHLDTKLIIEGVGLDPRIGEYYNNPSFGYGGYCLPKDSKQLLASYQNIPQNMMSAIVESNTTRKEFIVKQILDRISYHKNIKKKIVGIYRLTMKYNSDNFRQSAIQEIIEKLRKREIPVVIYEPTLKNETIYKGCSVINHIEEFKMRSDLIIANRYNVELDDVKSKVYTRDIYERD